MTKYEEIVADAKQRYPKAEEFFDGPPVQVVAICLMIGIDVTQSPMAYAGSISWDLTPPEKFIIAVNEHHSLEQRRFTVAHELAHFFLHADKIKEKSVLFDLPLKRAESHEYSHLEKEDELEANKLAAEIIMPRKQIKKRQVELIEVFGPNEQSYIAKLLAAEYAVPVPAMKVRLGLSI